MNLPATVVAPPQPQPPSIHCSCSSGPSSAFTGVATHTWYNGPVQSYCTCTATIAANMVGHCFAIYFCYFTNTHSGSNTNHWACKLQHIQLFFAWPHFQIVFMVDFQHKKKCFQWNYNGWSVQEFVWLQCQTVIAFISIACPRCSVADRLIYMQPENGTICITDQKLTKKLWHFLDAVASPSSYPVRDVCRFVFFTQSIPLSL